VPILLRGLQPVVVERVVSDHKGPGGCDTDCEEPRQNSSEYIHFSALSTTPSPGRSHADNATSLGAFSDDAMAVHQCCKSSTPASQGRCRNTEDAHQARARVAERLFREPLLREAEAAAAWLFAPKNPWFQNRPELIDRLEEVLTKFYASDNKDFEWQSIWIAFARFLSKKASR
jgi:hypothetical protein